MMLIRILKLLKLMFSSYTINIEKLETPTFVGVRVVNSQALWWVQANEIDYSPLLLNIHRSC